MRALAWLIVLAVAWAPVHADGKGKRKGKRANMPAGWTWPPSAAMKRDGKACKKRLDTLGVAWKAGKRTRKIATPVVVPSMEFGALKLSPTFRKPPFVMDCHLALALARQSEVARQLGVKELRFSSIHSYRRVRSEGKTKKALSRHALGLAVDVYEVVLDDDSVLVIERDYKAEGSLLPRLEQALNDTGAFRRLLTPASDPRSHYDHFHISARMPQPE